MSALPDFRFSDAVREASPQLPFGLVVARGVQVDILTPVIEARKIQATQDLQRALFDVRANIAAFSEFFAEWGFTCPLPDQLKAVQKKGFPRISPFVDALLVCEMTTGVLMGVQDLDHIEGELVYDIARPGETFEGLRGLIICQPGEIVLRDEQAIIASYFQGPDRRTSVSPTTSALVFFVFGAPRLAQRSFDDALSLAADIVAPAAEDVEFELYLPSCAPNSHNG